MQKELNVNRRRIVRFRRGFLFMEYSQSRRPLRRRHGARWAAPVGKPLFCQRVVLPGAVAGDEESRGRWVGDAGGLRTRRSAGKGRNASIRRGGIPGFFGSELRAPLRMAGLIAMGQQGSRAHVSGVIAPRRDVGRTICRRLLGFYRLPRRSCSRSMASKRALKFPLPKLRLPRR